MNGKLDIIPNLKSAEHLADKVIDLRSQCITYDKLRQKTREAIHITKMNNSGKHWIQVSGQFFQIHNKTLHQIFETDMKTYSSELDNLNKDLKDTETTAHRRFNPLLGHWIIVSSNRISRPWTGDTLKSIINENSEIGILDPSNPLSPGSTRFNGIRNPNYTSTYVFKNDFQSEYLEHINNEPLRDDEDNPLFRTSNAIGESLVMCYHPYSNKSLNLLALSCIEEIIMKWIEITKSYERNPCYKWVQIFENHGSAVGCSNPHPHCQVWSSHFLPTLADRMDFNQKSYFQKYKRIMLNDYIEKENYERSPRFVCSNEDWIIFAPWWGQWPFETILLPKKRTVRVLTELSHNEISSLAMIMKEILNRFDNLFKADFPYCFGWFQNPLNRVAQENEHWLLHAVWYPPLLRSENIKKYVAGYELFAEFQRDLTPEMAAEKLRNCSTEHYKNEKT